MYRVNQKEEVKAFENSQNLTLFIDSKIFFYTDFGRTKKFKIAMIVFWYRNEEVMVQKPHLNDTIYKMSY